MHMPGAVKSVSSIGSKLGHKRAVWLSGNKHDVYAIIPRWKNRFIEQLEFIQMYVVNW